MEGALQRNVGLNLRRYREDRGLSQEAFADAVGIHRTYMGGLERGERNLTLRTVERIAESLDLDPQELLRPPPLAAPQDRRTRPPGRGGNRRRGS